MKIHYKYLVLLFSIFTFMSCFFDKDDNTPAGNQGEGSISGKVIDGANGALAGVYVTIHGQDQKAVTNENGEFSFLDIPAGKYTLYFNRYGYKQVTEDDIDIIQGQVYHLTGHVTMTSIFCTIKGKILLPESLTKRSASAQTVEGVGITVPNQNISTVTNSNGGFTLENVIPDAGKIMAARSGTGCGVNAITLTAGEVKENVIISLNQDGGSIAGVVEDEGGNVVAGVSVTAMGGAINAVTDAHGRYRLANIPADVPVTISGSSHASISGLMVDEHSQLDGVTIGPKSEVAVGDVSLNSRRFIIPNDGQVVVEADVSVIGKSLAEAITAFLWDLDNDGNFDTTSSSSLLKVSSATDGNIIPFGVITVSGDTVKGANISIRLVSSTPAITVGAAFTVRPKEAAVLLGQAVCLTGGITSYQWDFNGDGIYDWKRGDLGTVTYRYFKAGTYPARFLVTTASGKRDSGSVTITVTGDPAVLAAGEFMSPAIISPQSGTKTGSDFTLLWYNVSADSYSIYIDTLSPPLSHYATVVADTSLQVTSLPADVQHYIQITAFKGQDAAISISAGVITSVDSVVDPSTVTDIDGNVYKTIKIGNQIWMAENLKVTRYRDSSAITLGYRQNDWLDSFKKGVYCMYNNDSANTDVYGLLYNFHAVSSPRILAPEGWHVASSDEWKELEMFLGMSQANADLTLWRGTDEGGKLKETGTTHWTAPNTGATDETGFTALPAGVRSDVGAFSSIGLGASFWTSTGTTASNNTYALKRSLTNAEARISSTGSLRLWGFSVRCIKD